MIRLVVVVEGQTEEAFVNEVLGPHLDSREVFTSAMIVSTRRDRTGKKAKGGGMHWTKWRNDIERVLATDRSPELRVTTMFDLYGLPRDFPGKDRHGGEVDTARKAALLEAAMSEVFGDRRLVPYLQRHEFEALVLCGLDHLEAVLDPADRAGVRGLRREVGATPPEEINDGEHTAPSKRLITHLGVTYDKVTLGPLVTAAVGLPGLRAACPRFDGWLTTLESLAGQIAP